MTKTAFTRNLLDQMTVERATVERGEMGEEVLTWVEHLADVACRFVEKSERVADNERGFVQTKTFLVLTAVDHDIEPKDRLTNFVLADGEVLADEFLVEEVLKRRIGKRSNHLSLAIERIK